MTPTSAPGLMGLAPPASVPPGPTAAGTPPPPGDGESPQGTFAALLQSVTAMATGQQGGGETAATPGGVPSMPDGPPDVAALLAQLIGLMRGADAEGATDGSAQTTDGSGHPLLLDRLAGAEGNNEELSGLAAVEALMAYLVMNRQPQAGETALPSLPADVLALLQTAHAGEGLPSAHEAVAAATELLQGGASQASLTSNLTTGSTGPGTAVPDAELPAAAAEAGMEPGGDALTGVVEPAPAALQTSDDVAGNAEPETTSTPQVSTTGGDASADDGAERGTPAAVVVEETTPVGDRRPEAGPRTEASAPESDAMRTADAAAMVNALTPERPVRTETVASARVTNAATLPAEVADTVRMASLRGDSEVRLVLNPPDLGHLDIRIISGDAGIRITMEASQSGARELLDRSLVALHQALEARDLRVDRLEVRAADTGRGSLDTSTAGHQFGGSAGSGGGFNGGDGTPDWSPVAALGGAAAMTEGSAQPETKTAGDGRVDVLA